MKTSKKSLIRKIVLSVLALLVPSFLFFLPSCQPKAFDLESTVEIIVNNTLAGIPSATIAPTITQQPTGTIQPTYTKQPTHTQQPTYTPFPTLTVRPTYTPLATQTKRPTYTPLPTSTRRPTYTPYPTSTFRPTYTPLATNTRQATYTPLPTHTPAKTYTPLPTLTSEPTYTKVPTYTPQPTFTSLPTSTPRPTYTPVISYVMVTPTTDESILKADKTDGYYLIGPEIQPGVWRPEKDKTKCYWKITDIKGNIVQNYLGDGGGTIYIDPDAFQIEILNCGKITYIETYDGN